MLQVSCIATTEAEAEGLVSRILEMGVRREDIFIAAGSSEIDGIALPMRELRHHLWRGLGWGAAIGWFVGTAMILILAASPVPWNAEAVLIPMSTALACMVLGTVAGASGGFCKPHISPNLAHHYEEEVNHGRVLISVELDDASKREKVAAACIGSGGMDLHYSDEVAA